jgi:hypothetical protein
MYGSPSSLLRHPPSRRRVTRGKIAPAVLTVLAKHTYVEMYCTYEGDIKFKTEHDAGISWTFCLSIETINRPPQAREAIPLKSK